MKLEQQETKVISSNLQEKEVFTSQINDSSIIIDYLRNKMYSNKIQTPVQEYMSNALDAMKQKGNKAKIRVTLPTGIKRELRIRDYGPGLDEEGMKTVFSQYAASNKTHTDGQIGGYGLGSKSGWAYGPAFMVNSFYNGKKRVYVAQIADNQEGKFSLETTLDTNEDNGLEIIIPVTSEYDIKDFVKAVYRAGCLWDNQPEIIEDSKGYSKVYDIINKPIFKGNGFKVYEKNSMMEEIFSLSWSKPSIILNCDGIPYTLPDMSEYEFPMMKALSDFFKGSFVVLDFKTGEVAIQPDRERVANSETNKTNIYNKIQEVYSKLLNLRIRRFYNPKNIHDYAKKLIEDKELFGEQIVRTDGEKKSARSYGYKRAFSRKSGVTSTLKNYLYEEKGYKVLLEERYGKYYLFLNNLRYGKEKVFTSFGEKFSRELIEYSINGSKFHKHELYNMKGSIPALPVKFEDNKLKIHKNNTAFVRLNEPTTNYMIRRKVKHYLTQGYAESVIVLPEGFIDSLPLDEPENTINISSMALPEKQKTVKAEGFGFYAFERNWRNSHPVRKRKTISNVNDVEKKYVYMTLEKNKAPKYYDNLASAEQTGLWNYFQAEGYELILIAKSSIEVIKDNDNFTSFEDFQKNKMAGDTLKMEIANAINLDHYSFNWIGSLKKEVWEDLEFTALKDFYKLVQSVKGSKTIPSSLVKSKEENKEIVEAIVNFQKELYNYLGDNFRLLKTISSSYMRDEERVEVIDYINALYKKVIQKKDLETIPEIDSIIN